MNTERTETSKTVSIRTPYEDLRRAIASDVFVQAKHGAIIVASEHTGARESWLFDFRALMLQPRWLDRYAEIFWEHYASRLPFQVGGIETASIPLVTAIVMKSVERGTPVNGFYIRKSRKRQGLMKRVEGTVTDAPIILVDDLMNSGQSINRQIDVLESAGKTVSDVYVMLTFRADEAYSFLAKRGVSLRHLFTLADFEIPLLKSKSPAIPHDPFEVVWRYAAPNPSYHLVVQKSAPTLDEAHVFFGCDDGTFRALEQKTGELAWEFSTGRHPTGKGILSSPVLHKGVIYFGAYDGNVYALDAVTGNRAWSYGDADWVGSSPYVAPDLGLIFIGLEFGLWKRRGGIVALDLKTGAPKWTAYHESLTHGSPLYIPEESLVVVGSNNGVLYAYDAKSGDIRWTFQSRGDVKTRAAYDAKRRAVIFGSMDGVLYALAAHDGTPLYVCEAGAGIYSIPLVHNDTVYVASLDKCLYALDGTDGNKRWEFETSGRIFASPTLHEGSLWIGSNDGRLYELDPDTGKLKNFFQTTERVVNTIAYNEGRLFIPTVANELYCIKRKADTST